MFPPSVPRFWICAAPIVAAASTSAGQVLAAQRRAADLRVRGPGAEDERRRPRARCRAASSIRDRSSIRSGIGPSSPVIATMMSVPPAIGRVGPGGEVRVRLEQVRGACRSAARPASATGRASAGGAAAIRAASSANPPRIWRGVNATSSPSFSSSSTASSSRWSIASSSSTSSTSSSAGAAAGGRPFDSGVDMRRPRRSRRRSSCSPCSGTGCRRSPRGSAPRPGRRRRRGRPARP